MQSDAPIKPGGNGKISLPLIFPQISTKPFLYFKMSSNENFAFTAVICVLAIAVVVFICGCLCKYSRKYRNAGASFRRISVGPRTRHHHQDPDPNTMQTLVPIPIKSPDSIPGNTTNSVITLFKTILYYCRACP